MNQHEPMANLVAREQPAKKQPDHEIDAPQVGNYPMPSKMLFFGVVVLLAGVVGLGLYGHWRQDAAASDTQEQTVNFVPTVRTITATAQTKPGDLLVRIAAPDLDRQLDQAIAQLDQTNAALLQAQAQVSQADANLKLAQLN